MLQVVLSEAAKAGARLAARWDSAAAIGVIGGADGQTERDEARQEERQRQAAQCLAEQASRAKPLDCAPEDVLLPAFCMDMGDISAGAVSPAREALLRELLCANAWGEQEHLQESAAKAWKGYVADHDTLLRRAAQGEPVRIWYSDTPYAICGFYSMVWQLRGCKCHITAVRLPSWHRWDDGAVHSPTSWGEVAPGDWAAHLPLETEVTDALRAVLEREWQLLCIENAPLRAVLCGSLSGVPETFYDCFLLQEAERAKGQAAVVKLIGGVLGRYRLCISDWWLAQRVRHLLKTGALCMVQENAVFYSSLVQRGEQQK